MHFAIVKHAFSRVGTAIELHSGMTNNRLDSIANRQRTSRIRDLAFAVVLVFAGAIEAKTISIASHADHVQLARR